MPKSLSTTLFFIFSNLEDCITMENMVDPDQLA